jgi:transcriptional regulator GlxA family with amidase domain
MDRPAERLALDHEARLACLYASQTRTPEHSQWGVALLVGLESALTIETPAGTAHGRVILVPAGVRHRTTSPGPSLCIVLDADHHRATMLATRRDGALVLGHAPPPRVDQLARAMITAAAPRNAALGLIGEYLPTGAAPIADRRIARIVERFDAADGALGTQAELAAELRVSPSHLSTTFRQHVGITLRAWLGWKRTTKALARLRRGRLAEAAATGGFADHAHLTRTFGERLGYGPARLADAAALACGL